MTTTRAKSAETMTENSTPTEQTPTQTIQTASDTKNALAPNTATRVVGAWSKGAGKRVN